MFADSSHGRRVHGSRSIDRQDCSDRTARDRGAAAVEFAIVVPLLLLILLALVDFGRLYFVQVSLAGASREGARALSLHRDATAVDSIVQASSPGAARLSTLGDSEQLAVVQDPCAAGSATNAAVTVSTQFDWFTPIGLLNFYDESAGSGESITLSSRSEMLCVG